MERRIVTEVPIDEIVVVDKLYPRTGYNWQTGYDYSESMKSGAKFPMVTLALHDNKKVLVDGRHRIEAYKKLKKKKIKAEVFVGWNEARIYTEAVKRNIAHGRSLSPYEKRLIIMRLREMKFKDNQISELIQITPDKMKSFVAQRLVNAISGETISSVVIKNGLKHLAGKQLDVDESVIVQNTQQPMYIHGQLDLLNQLIDLIERRLFDLEDPEIVKRFNYLIDLINNKNLL